MRKAKKKLHRMPRLSLPDQLIYWICLFLLGAVYFLLGFSPMILREKITFSDPSVIAMSESISGLWALVPGMTFFLTTFIPWARLYNDRYPIFGLRNFKYGPPAWPKVYPLFMKNKPYVWVSKKKQKEKQQIALFLVLMVLVSFLFYPISLFGRNCLMEDGRIRQYSMFNNRKADHAPQEMETVEFSVYKYTTGKYSRITHWDIRITFTTGSGKEYAFESKDFRRDMGHDSWLTEMLRLKGLFDPSFLRYHRTEDLNRVVLDNEMTASEASLLYQLFDVMP